MQRCAARALPGLLIALMLGASAQAQAPRNFPANALRGEIVVIQPPEIGLNGKAASLAPGSRIRGENNLMLVSGGLIGQRLIVNYTLDMLGQLMDVWILTDDERARRPWPATAGQAAAWTFDASTQTWSRP
jgi:hypothetical protein